MIKEENSLRRYVAIIRDMFIYITYTKELFILLWTKTTQNKTSSFLRAIKHIYKKYF